MCGPDNTEVHALPQTHILIAINWIFIQSSWNVSSIISTECVHTIAVDF